MTEETALQILIAAIALATVGLVISEVVQNLRRERARDAEREAGAAETPVETRFGSHSDAE